MVTETMASADTATTKMNRMSRYRSVRRAQDDHTPLPVPCRQEPSSPPPIPLMPAPSDRVDAQKDVSLSRSMSRYHRRPATSHATTSNAPPPLPSSPIQPLPPPPPPLPCTPSSPSSHNRALSPPHHPSPAANNAHCHPRSPRQPTDASPSGPNNRHHHSQRGEENARLLMQKERDRQRLLKEKYDGEVRAKKEAKQAEINRLEQLRKKEEEQAAHLKAQREAKEAEALRQQEEEQKAEKELRKRLRKATPQRHIHPQEQEVSKTLLGEAERKVKSEENVLKAYTQSPPVSPPRHDGGFGLFRRRKEGDTPTQETRPSLRSRQTNGSARESDTIKPGGGGAVLNIDAPMSAVNAGDRFVTVICSNKHILLPVKPTTTPLDLIKSAATVLTVPIDVRTAVVTEQFAKVCISRPLRNFEYVREVMNSWDSDNQNQLTIVDSTLDGVDQDDLLAYKVPDARPEGASCFIQYSSKPGKWSKRYITLRSDGQLVMSKNEKSKDQEKICTLTDYDIYTVLQQKLAKIKPPKKICYAVKSMQKSNIFAEESQYVHFFCTNDRSIATTFYKALQGWRSWHLKHEKGEGTKKKSVAQRAVAGSAEQSQTTSSHNRGESVGSHYELGTYSSLMDLDSFNKTLDQIEVHKPGEFPEDAPLSRFDTKVMQARNKSLRVKQSPPPLFKGGLVAEARNQNGTNQSVATQNSSRQNSLTQSVSKHDEEETFAAGGLLGRTYTQRQRVAQDREPKQNGAFTDGPSLISNNMDRFNMALPNDSSVSRKSSVRSNHNRTSSDLQRHSSKRLPGMPEPLIDLKPTYRPPPQFSKENKGKGYSGATGSGPLVEHATFTLPEEAIKVPSAYRGPPQFSKEGKGKGYTGPIGSGPLVDHATFTLPEEAIKVPSAYRGPPQFSKEGKGKGYSGAIGSGPLVEHATFTLPEEAIKVPAASDPWSGRPTTSRAHGAIGSGTHEQTRTLKGRGEPLAAHAQNNHSAVPEDDRMAFTGGSLLSQTSFPVMNGGAPVGRGVMDGSKARGPMLDLSDMNQFASGSLLSSLPDNGGPIIDRSGK